MTDKITSWPPVIMEWVSDSGQSLQINGHDVRFDLFDGSRWWLLLVPLRACYSYIWNEQSSEIKERVDGTSESDAAIAGFNRLIELGIVKRRPPIVPVDCDGPVDDAPTFLDSLE